MADQHHQPPNQSGLFRLFKALGIDEIFHPSERPPSLETRQQVLGAQPDRLAELYPVELTKRIQDHLTKIVGEQAAFIRSDWVIFLHSLVVRSQTQKELLLNFRPFIYVQHYEALALACAVKNLRDLELSEKAIALKDGLFDKYGDAGAAIEHLYSTGYIEGLFDFERRWMIGTDERSAPRLYAEWFSRQIRFFPHAVYLSDRIATPRDVYVEVLKRVQDGRQREVRVYSAGAVKNGISRDACKAFLKENSQWACKRREYPYGTTSAMEVRLFLKTDPSEFSDSLDGVDWRNVR